ncbi:MAG: phasin family protein [Pseudomonadota bacterium]
MTTAAKKTAAPKPAAKTPSATDDAATAIADQIDSAFATFTESTEAMRDQADEMLSMMQTNFETFSQRTQALNADVLEAARDEMTETVEFMSNLARAESPTDALALQQDFWTSLVENRMAFARDFTNGTVEAMRETAEPTNAAFKTPAMDTFFPFAKVFAAK